MSGIFILALSLNYDLNKLSIHSLHLLGGAQSIYPSILFLRINSRNITILIFVNIKKKSNIVISDGDPFFFKKSPEDLI